MFNMFQKSTQHASRGKIKLIKMDFTSEGAKHLHICAKKSYRKLLEFMRKNKSNLRLCEITLVFI